MDIRTKLGIYNENTDKKPVGTVSSGKDIPAGIPGTVCSNNDGSFYVMENRYPLSHIHGGCCLGAALNINERSLSWLCGKSDGAIPVNGFLFLDTETTGLSGGTGTVAFLVGTGFFEDGAFVVRQYFMRDYDEEPAMLRELNKVFSAYAGLVTFNGKSFDWNLLQGRFISNRIRILLKDPLHLDLLFPARRIWGLKHDSCRLSSLEENELEERRIDDIPGVLIPSVYFKYLEDRKTADIKRVIKHNELDILSMVSLLVKMSVMLDNPLSEAGGEHELLGLGRIFEARGEFEMTVDCFESCAKSANFSIKAAAVRRLTGMYKRNGDYDRAFEHCRQILADSGGSNLYSMIEIAMYYEHRVKDISKALEIVEKAVRFCLMAGLTENRQLLELRKRQERLRKKMARYNGEDCSIR